MIPPMMTLNSSHCKPKPTASIVSRITLCAKPDLVGKPSIENNRLPGMGAVTIVTDKVRANGYSENGHLPLRQVEGVTV